MGGMTQLTTSRTIAIILSLMGAVWCAMLFARQGFSGFSFIPESSIYFVTAGYLVRAVTVPPLKLRCFIWSASIIINFQWFGWAGSAMGRAAWCAFAVIASIVALVCEKNSPISAVIDSTAPSDRAKLSQPACRSAPDPN
jgi:hypothetical protein